jgi:hypothetical protein
MDARWSVTQCSDNWRVEFRDNGALISNQKSTEYLGGIYYAGTHVLKATLFDGNDIPVAIDSIHIFISKNVVIGAATKNGLPVTVDGVKMMDVPESDYLQTPGPERYYFHVNVGDTHTFTSWQGHYYGFDRIFVNWTMESSWGSGQFTDLGNNTTISTTIGDNAHLNVYQAWYHTVPKPVTINLTSTTGTVNNPIKIYWAVNVIDDGSTLSYEISRMIDYNDGQWHVINSSTPNNYFIDNDFLYVPNAGDFGVSYRVRVKGDEYSNYSNIVSTRAEDNGMDWKKGNNTKEFSQLGPEVEPVTSYSLNQNYPNPFNPATMISYAIPKDGNVSLKVYDMVGHEVADLVHGYKSAGRYSVNFDASKLSSGMYIYKIQAGTFSSIKKMQVVK